LCLEKGNSFICSICGRTDFGSELSDNATDRLSQCSRQHDMSLNQVHPIIHLNVIPPHPFDHPSRFCLRDFLTNILYTFLVSSPNRIRVNKSRTITWPGHVVRMEK
jgi:hypothetical protein